MSVDGEKARGAALRCRRRALRRVNPRRGASRPRARNTKNGCRSRGARNDAIPRVVFDIKGNDFRRVAALQYRAGVLASRFFGAHREYDAIDAETA